MKKILLAILGVVLVSGGAYAVSETLNSEPETYSWRYKMTVEIDTPEGVKSGSAVREVSVVITPTDNNERGYYSHSTIKGEAVVIDLGQKGKVFALLVGKKLGVDHAKDLPFYLFDSPRGGMTREGAEYYSKLQDQSSVPEEYYPMFVSFEDYNEPETVYSIDVTQEFKSDLKLKSINVSMTDDHVTNYSQNLLPWLPDYYNKRLDGNSIGRSNAENKTANGLSSGAFSVNIIDIK